MPCPSLTMEISTALQPRSSGSCRSMLARPQLAFVRSQITGPSQGTLRSSSSCCRTSRAAQQRRRVVCPRAAADGEDRKKTGAELREEFFLAAATGKERGLPEGAFLNDNVESGPLVDITWEPYGDTCSSHEGSSLLKSAVDAGALTIDNRFCLTGQCDVCIVEIEGGEVVRSCMVPVPKGKKELKCLVLDTDDAWAEMMV